MYFVFKSRIASIYVFYKLCNTDYAITMTLSPPVSRREPASLKLAC